MYILTLDPNNTSVTLGRVVKRVQFSEQPEFESCCHILVLFFISSIPFRENSESATESKSSKVRTNSDTR